MGKTEVCPASCSCVVPLRFGPSAPVQDLMSDCSTSTKMGTIYIHINLHTYILTYVRTYIHTYIFQSELVRFESFSNRNLTTKRRRRKPGIENSIKNVRFESFSNRNLTQKRGRRKPGIENSIKTCKISVCFKRKFLLTSNKIYFPFVQAFCLNTFLHKHISFAFALIVPAYIWWCRRRRRAHGDWQEWTCFLRLVKMTRVHMEVVFIRPYTNS